MKVKGYNAGDLVFDDENKVCRISISYTSKKAEFECYSNDDDIQVEYKDLEGIYLSKVVNPIPLTEELLLKCRFEKKKGVLVLNIEGKFKYLRGYIVNNGFSCAIDEYSPMLERESVSLNTVAYLHQLQNLYYALTGKELDIKL